MYDMYETKNLKNGITFQTVTSTDIGDIGKYTRDSIILPVDDNIPTVHTIHSPNGEFKIGLAEDIKKSLFDEFLNKLTIKPLLKHNCNNCGGTIELDSEKHIFICPYCGTVYAIGTNMINDLGDC